MKRNSHIVTDSFKEAWLSVSDSGSGKRAAADKPPDATSGIDADLQPG